MSYPPLSAHELELLRKHDTPTVCNVIELFNVRPRNTGYMDQRIRACFPELRPMVGYATTATFRSAAPARGDAYASLEKQVAAFVEVPAAPIVVFQDLDDPSAAATFGEVMCTTYKTFGANGLITSGTGRDLDQVRAIGFPVFTNGANCSHGYVHLLHIHQPVQVGGLTVYPNDLLHGDCNGVTSIPHEIAAEVAEIGDEFVAAEKIILDALHEHGASLKHYDAARATAHEQMAAIRKRVTRSP